MSSERSGPVGWMDAHGDGSWAIGLRSADVHVWTHGGLRVPGAPQNSPDGADAQDVLVAGVNP